MKSSTPTKTVQAPETRAEAVARVAEWIIAGMRPSQIPAQTKKEGWELSPAETLTALDEAHELLALDTEVDLAKEDAKSVARFNLLYTRSLAIQDYKTALSAQVELAKTVARISNPFNVKPKTNARKKTKTDRHKVT